MGMGEADGWWMTSEADQLLHVNNADRAASYEMFMDHFEWRLLQYDAPVTAMAFTPPHGVQWLNGGLVNTITAETSQASINAQLSYMFIRGAGKQYGVIWLLNPSLCSRFGTKCESGALSIPHARLRPR